MTTRQEATQHAIRWACRANDTAKRYEDTRSNERAGTPGEQELKRDHAQRIGAFRDQERDMALMWARIAPLLPAVLDDTQLDQQPQQCASHHHFGPTGHGRVRCDRQHGHRGIHTTGGFQWLNQDRANAAPATSQSSPGPVAVSLPGQRPNTEDAQPRCLSRYQAADGVERCERDAGHPGIHQGVTVGWRSEQAIIGPDYATADHCPSRFQAAGAVERCAEPAGHTGPHRGATCQWFSVHAIPADEPEPTVVEPSCCETAVLAAAAHLRVHARNAPGLSAYERRCLEDAVEFLTHHASKGGAS